MFRIISLILSLMLPTEPPRAERLQIEPIHEEVVKVEQEALNEPVDVEFETLVRATWRLETGNGSSYVWLNYNNAGGIKCGEDYCVYESGEEGMKQLRLLLQEYVNKYGHDYKAIRERYCQCGIDDYYKFMDIYYEELDNYIN